MSEQIFAQEIKELSEKHIKVHYAAGPIHQRIERFKAEECMKRNELEAIYHLVESHVPSLRLKTVLRYEKILTSLSDNAQLSLCKNHVASNCTTTKIEDNVRKMLEKIKEMPPEWTLVQLTPHYNDAENAEVSLDKYYTNSLYLTVFNCGEKQRTPFCVNIEAPRDSVSGSVVHLLNEIHSIVRENKETLTFSRAFFANVPERQSYYARRQSVDDRLKMLVKDLQDLYLKEWKCFLIGKYINNELEYKIQRRIKDFFQVEAPWLKITEKDKSILHYLVKGNAYLKLSELRNAIQKIIPGDEYKKIQKNLAQFIRNLSEELSLGQEKRHPLILIIDDSLDCFPWEMMEIFTDASVSRLPSLHLAYALYQEHKGSIKNGFKVVKNVNSGTYVVNPDLDLKNMENRILSFYDYWLPAWKGVAGCEITEEQFEKMLLSGEIFAYNGHGSGTHYFPMNKIERIRINAIVFLFGCSSTKLNRVGPQTEMYSTYQVYLIACSPCIVGNLWEVTDLDTDILTTELLSQWIPNPDKIHWRFLDKAKWKKGERVQFPNKSESSPTQPHEPELLKALSIAKKSNLLSFYITRAALVARGIPVKIEMK